MTGVGTTASSAANRRAMQLLDELFEARQESIARLKTLLDLGAVSQSDFDHFLSKTQKVFQSYQYKLLNSNVEEKDFRVDPEQVMSLSTVPMTSISYTAQTNFRKYLVDPRPERLPKNDPPLKDRHIALSINFINGSVLPGIWRYLDRKDRGRLRVAAFHNHDFKKFQQKTQDVTEAAFDAVLDDDLKSLTRLLVEDEVDVNSCAFDAGINAEDTGIGKGFTLLMYAAEHCRECVVSKLLASGADPNIRDENGVTLFRHMQYTYDMYTRGGLTFDAGRTIGFTDVVALLKVSGYRLGPGETWDLFSRKDHRAANLYDQRAVLYNQYAKIRK